MTKIRKNYRLSSDVIEMMETLVVFLSSEKNIRLNETTLIELLVSERYERLLNGSEGSERGSERGSE